ncbi:MAG: hypothetical protein GX148_03925 [Clostridiales bacterium]|nr:hypothetical protein [Clostridiales bacterium]
MRGSTANYGKDGTNEILDCVSDEIRLRRVTIPPSLLRCDTSLCTREAEWRSSVSADC